MNPDRTLNGTAGKVCEIQHGLRPPGIGIACIGWQCAGGIENESAIRRGNRAKAVAVAARPFELEIGFRGIAQYKVCAIQQLVSLPGILADTGQSETNMVVEPDLGPAAIAVSVDTAGSWRIFIIDDQMVLVAAQCRGKYCPARRHG